MQSLADHAAHLCVLHTLAEEHRLGPAKQRQSVLCKIQNVNLEMHIATKFRNKKTCSVDPVDVRYQLNNTKEGWVLLVKHAIQSERIAQHLLVEGVWDRPPRTTINLLGNVYTPCGMIRFGRTAFRQECVVCYLHHVQHASSSRNAREFVSVSPWAAVRRHAQ
jgi:hypothetical protein